MKILIIDKLTKQSDWLDHSLWNRNMKIRIWLTDRSEQN